MLKVLELFAGIGAFSSALERLNIPHEVVDAVEIDKYAIKSFNAIHGTDFEPQDITKWDKDLEVDLIMHGSPCFRRGELVNTIYGLMPIEQIKTGDIVRTAGGHWKAVTETFVSKNNTLMDIKPSCAHLINTTENHPFYVLREGELTWVKAKDLTTKDYLCVPINTAKKEPKWDGVDLCYNGHTEHSCKLPILDGRFWYLVGRFIGDGWVTRRKERANNISGIKICCAKNELVELEQKLDGVLPYNTVEDATTYKLQFCNKELGTFCKEFGIGAVNKHIPQWVLDLDKEYLLPLYEGIMDSDGCCVKRRYKLETASKRLAYNMGELVLKLFNVPYQINKTTRPKKCTIEGRTVNQHDTYSTFWRNGGHNRRINFVKDGFLFSRVRRIESIDGIDTVYNLEVADEHTYCVNNVAVHNCQDFSVAGKQAGGDEGSGTRSSLMYETLRIIDKTRPKFVIWENVKNLLSKKHRHNFDMYLERMEKLGYKSFYQVLNSKNYGVPQNRERVFTISILGGSAYKFPEPVPLDRKLKDVLEKDVDESFYLDSKYQNLVKVNSNYGIMEGGTIGKMHDSSRRAYSVEYVPPTIPTCAGENIQPKIIEPTPLQKEVADRAIRGGYVMPNDAIDYTFSNARLKEMDNGRIKKCNKMDNQVAPTLKTEPQKLGICVEDPYVVASRGRGETNEQRLEPRFDGTTNTITSVQKDNYVATPYRIRRLTPKECWRLQGFTDEEFAKAEMVCSNTQLYKQAGNSITVDVLVKIIENLLY